MRCVRALLHDRAGLACLLFLGIVLLAALLAPWLTPWDPLAVDGSRKLVVAQSLISVQPGEFTS